jgi:Zn-dependent peptidase ImmA (M78 family)
MNYKQFVFAREFRGYTQTEFSKSIDGLSQSNLSKFEKGFDVLSDKTIDKMIEKLEFPRNFFNKKIFNTIEISHYRKKTTLTLKKVQKFELACQVIGGIIDDMSLTIDWIPFNFNTLNIEEGFSPIVCAKNVRKKLKIDSDQPIKDIFNLFESNGIIIYEIETDEKIDGVSFITKKGFPVIVINKNFSNDRKRFTLAHELGHIIMHYSFPIPTYRETELEKEANAFASEFLMPSNEIKNQLKNLKLSDLSFLKNYWLTSMRSIIYKSFELKCISKDKYTYFNIEFSRLGYNKIEPISVYIDEAKVFENAYYLFKNDLEYSLDDFKNYFNLPEEILNNIFSFKRSKLKVFR